MHRFFIAQPFAQEMNIIGLDAHHIIDVLRMQPGSKLQIVADDGISFIGEVVRLGANQVSVRAIEILRESGEPTVQISLLQGLAKGDKMDTVVQKAVEIGVTDIYPVALTHSVVVLDAARAAKKTERWAKIAEAAAKQSKRDIVPLVHPVMPLAEAIAEAEPELLLAAYESENQVGLKAVLQAHKKARRISVVIGPEGGLTNEEIAVVTAAGGVSASLGRRILRTETAGLVVAAAILYETDNLGSGEGR